MQPGFYFFSKIHIFLQKPTLEYIATQVVYLRKWNSNYGDVLNNVYYIKLERVR